MRKEIVACVFLLAASACGGDSSNGSSGSSGGASGASGDSGTSGDAGTSGDTGTSGSGSLDAGPTDGGPANAVPLDAARSDASRGDAASADAALADAALADARSDATLGAGPEAGLDASLDADSTAADAGCNAVVNAAPGILTAVSDAASTPAATGGNLVSGTYFLTSLTAFGALPECAGIRVSGTIVVSTAAASLDGVITYTVISPVSTPFFGDYVAAGTALTVTPTCSSAVDGAVSVFAYSATPTQITLVQPVTFEPACGTAVEVYAKQ